MVLYRVQKFPFQEAIVGAHDVRGVGLQDHAVRLVVRREVGPRVARLGRNAKHVAAAYM